MRRLFWLAMGITIGALLVRKLSRAAERLTPARHGRQGIGAGAGRARRRDPRVRRTTCARRWPSARRNCGRAPAWTATLGGDRPGAVGRAGSTPTVWQSDVEIRGDPPALPGPLRGATRPHVVPSVPLPFDDPNLLFVNAGMVQFVPYFVGQQTPPCARATSIQKCIRTPDIDEVGKTTRHGTFFQMNGNFSFGDYFKDGAIQLAWELSTTPVEQGGFGLDGERIWATVYLDDDEAHRHLAPCDRAADRADRPPGHGRQLLVDGHPRPVRPVQRALLRPRPRLRPRGRSGGRRGPLHGVLEPRLHAERARSVDRAAASPTSRSSASCRRRTSTPAWAWSGWPRCCRASTTSTRSTRPGRSWTGRRS